MKKLITTLALAGACVYGAQAQRTADIQIQAYPPLNLEGTAPITEVNCSVGDVDSFIMAYGIKNLGPDNLVVGDTVFVQDPESETETNSWIFILGEDVNMGDSLLLYAGKSSYASTKLLYVVEGESLMPSLAPFADGEYVYLYTITGVAGSDGEVTDAEFGNNYGGATVMFNDCTSSILNNSTATNINVYPNPTKGSLNFAYDFDKASGVTANVYDVTGRLVVTKDFGTQNVGTQNFTLDVANLSNGNYTLEVSTNNNKCVSKFVISK